MEEEEARLFVKKAIVKWYVWEDLKGKEEEKESLMKLGKGKWMKIKIRGFSEWIFEREWEWQSEEMEW